MSELANISKFRNISFERRTRCLVCGQAVSAPLIRLPQFPMTEIYASRIVREKVGFVDQCFHFCQRCGHGQLGHMIDVRLQYGEKGAYSFRSSQSETARRSASFFVDFMDDILGSKKFQHIVEIGCNDLFLLRLLQHRAQKLTGIDPILKTCKEKDLPPKIKAIGDFFENVNLEDEISIVICKDTLEHVGDPKEFMAKIIEKGTSETMFFFQFPCLETLLGGCRFDQVFHQHLNYFSLASIQYLLDALGCELVDYRFNFNLWGAILIAFRKRRKSVRQGKEKKIQKITSETILQRYAIFQKNMEVTNERLECFKEDKIYGYGAALMLPVLSYYLKNDLSSLKGIIDDDKKKDGLYYINLPVKIVHSSKMTHYQDAVVLITAISSSDNVRKIISKLSLLNPRDIIVPLNIF